MKSQKTPISENSLGTTAKPTSSTSLETELYDRSEVSKQNNRMGDADLMEINPIEGMETYNRRLDMDTSIVSQGHKLESSNGIDHFSAYSSSTASDDKDHRRFNSGFESAQAKGKKATHDLNEDVSADSKKETIRENRKRKSKRDPSANSSHDSTWLFALDKQGRETRVKIILASQPYYDERQSSMDRLSPSDRSLGKDGNQHYCQVCRDFGDVVCCDGCPRVYHHQCIPLHSLSRISLDNDDDPWFCPKCIEKKKSVSNNDAVKILRSSSGAEKADRVSSYRRCVDCAQTRAEFKLVPCARCGAYVHSPSCIVGKSLDGNGKTHPRVCLNCQVIDQDEDTNTDTSLGNGKFRGSQRVKSDTDGSNGEDNEVEAHNVSVVKEKKTKQSRATLLVPKSKNGASYDKKLERKLKKKVKNRKRSMSAADQPETDDDDAARRQSIKDDPILQPRGSSTTVQAIPAFCFYLAENRWKIERSLSRKHRTFNRLPKGDERNALVAQEAAVWWTKLEPSEHKLYINMSMRDFESRIIQWKEEKDAREQLFDHDEIADEFVTDNDLVDGSTNEIDNQLTYEMHERLYLSTSVGSKPFKLESDQSYNRVLLDLLHDVRFHPLPMLNVNRPDIDGLLSDENTAKVTIPYFEIHGPVSTSLGDECLGCTRGWTHFCSVVQRRVPAVEHRAKLQPPLSSLLATRIGLGLRPRFDDDDTEEDTVKPKDENLKYDLLQWRESGVNKEVKLLPAVPSCHVFDPKDRGDDMTLFIEETVAMKIPEPPRPLQQDVSQQKKFMIRTLPTQRHRDSQGDGIDEFGDSLMYNKCGRCRSMIPNDTGCIPCRRAQLVINKSKILPSTSPKHGDGKSLRVHTTMLGRLHAKEGTGEVQTRSDQLVSEAMLKVRWCPSAIVPPQKLYTPTRKCAPSTDLSDEDDATEGEEDESSNTEEVIVNVRQSMVEASNESDAKKLLELAELSTLMTTEEQTVEEPPNKRLRSARSLSMVDKETIVPELDRPQLQKHYKKETSELQKKITRIACYGILLAVIRRDPLNLFEEPVTAEGYCAVIQNPICMKKIRENVVCGQYASITSFVADVRLLCENATAYNPRASIYYKTADDVASVLTVMHARANTWMSTIRAEQVKYLQQKETPDRSLEETHVEQLDDPFEVLRKTQPQVVALLDQEEKLRKLVASDFRRTVENETAYYGSLAIRRATVAAEASLAPYPDSCGRHMVVSKRKYYEDEDLRDYIDAKVSEVALPQLKSVSTWREEATLRLVRKVQKLRVERRLNADRNCSRTNIFSVLKSDGRRSAAYAADVLHSARAKKKGELLDVPRVAQSRGMLATGLASAVTCQRILQRSKDSSSGEDLESVYGSVSEACVSVRGSKTHGMGLFADQPFSKGDIVAEYIGEYIVNPVAEAREKFNEEQRVQDYQFRLDDTYVIDATTRGGWARYINHSCTPNCKTVIVPGDQPNSLLRRVMIVALRSIDFNEELSYDYQFPLELDLNARIPCNCHSEACRGFMNWDLPEKGTNNRALLLHKRVANMRDRIRRLGRPLKRGEI